MKIFYYCQHVLGMGHFFRSLEICKALKGEDILFLSGGPEPPEQMPDYVNYLPLPALCMDENFGGLKPLDEKRDLEEIKAERTTKIHTAFKNFNPDIFLVELFPFGRKAFRFELLPLMKDIKNGLLPKSKIVCSLRDILVERDDGGKHERMSVKTLNDFFDLVLVHSDEKVIKLDETFSRVQEIKPEIKYTGFVARTHSTKTDIDIRSELKLAVNDKLLVASAGGGKIGGPLLNSVVDAFIKLNSSNGLIVYTGPFLDEQEYNNLKHKASNSSAKIIIRRFTSEFVPLLKMADGLISMGGYNTMMDIVSTGIPALIHPFAQNREQKMRIDKMSGYINIDIIEENEINSRTMLSGIKKLLKAKRNTIPRIKIDGANVSAEILKNFKG